MDRVKRLALLWQRLPESEKRKRLIKAIKELRRNTRCPTHWIEKLTTPQLERLFIKDYLKLRG